MDWETWLEKLAVELGKDFACDGADYIRQTGEDCWREMYDDGMSPSEAAADDAFLRQISADEEVRAAMTMIS